MRKLNNRHAFQKTHALFKNTLWTPAPRVFFQQQRPFASNQPPIENLYNALLHQPTTSPMACNFISQILDDWAEKQPHHQALRCLNLDKNEPPEKITYATLAKHSHQIGTFFEEQGIQKGEAVALMLGQRPAWWYSVAGLMRKGIAIVPCPRLLTSKDLAYRINDLGIRGIITTPEVQNRVDAIRPACPSLISTVTTGTATPEWHALENLFNVHQTSTTSEITTTTEDPCVYLYTSGTTGQPKAVRHNHHYPFFHWPTGKRWLQATPQDLVYNASDTGWGFTLWITLGIWSTGANLLITPTDQKFNPQKMLTTLSQEPVTIFCAAPTVLRLLAAQPNFKDYTFPCLKRIVTVGEALDETVIEQFAARGVEVHVGFGQAETPLLMGRVDDQPHVPGTMGRPLDPYRIAVLDDQLQPLPSGNVGQIAVDLVEGKRGGLMQGYENAEEKTKKSFSPDGRYYLTGDRGKYLPNGFFAHIERLDDVIKSHGYRIGPTEVEEAGMSHPAVAKIAVIGVPAQLGSLEILVKAFILLKPGYSESPALMEDIQNHIKKETAAHKYPRRTECLSQKEWEQYETYSGKIRRAGLREREEQRLTKTDVITTEDSNPIFKV